jgi:predicted nucleotidyltransferase
VHERGIWRDVILTENAIRDAVERILQVARPSKVILFGSCARGDASPNSDLDLMVIMPGQPDKVAEMIRLRRAVGTGVDVLVFSAEEAERRGQVPGTVVYWANKEGKILYKAAAIPPVRYPEPLPVLGGSMPSDWKDTVHG